MVEIRPNIFIRKLPDGRTWISSLPRGYEDMKNNEEWLARCSDNTYCAKGMDVLEVILDEYCCNLFQSAKIKTEEGEKAVQEYEDYTGEKWKFERFIKRSN